MRSGKRKCDVSLLCLLEVDRFLIVYPAKIICKMISGRNKHEFTFLMADIRRIIDTRVHMTRILFLHYGISA